MLFAFGIYVCMCRCTRLYFIPFIFNVQYNNDCRLWIAVLLTRCPFSLTRLCDAAVFILVCSNFLSISSCLSFPSNFPFRFSAMIIKCSTHFLRLMTLTFVYLSLSFLSSFHFLASQSLAVLFLCHVIVLLCLLCHAVCCLFRSFHSSSRSSSLIY